MTDLDPIPSDKRQAIEMRLAEIEERHGVKILLAVESGSRAWGFPSADSDYDVRFIYVRSLVSYLSFKQPRDVIEQPIKELLDISGWDVRKAVGLALRSNATVGEWLTSPIVYRCDVRACGLLLDFVHANFSPRHYALHYLSFAEKQWRPHARTSTVKSKRYCYAMRTLLALCWTLDHRSLPPMAVDELLEGVGIPYDVEEALAEVRSLKVTGMEHDQGARVPVLDQWIAQCLETAPKRSRALWAHWSTAEAADRLFLQILG